MMRKDIKDLLAEFLNEYATSPQTRSTVEKYVDEIIDIAVKEEQHAARVYPLAARLAEALTSVDPWSNTVPILCHFCSAEFTGGSVADEHKPDCIYVQAKAVLAEWKEGKP